jgi:hypothetical protein
LLYTAAPPNLSSTTNYLADAKTWASGILTALTGTYELISENLNTEQENKICNASLSYKEILTNQTSALANDPGLVDLVTTYSLEVAQETDQTLTFISKGIPPLTMNVSFSTIIDHDITGSEDNINAYYTNKIRPMLLSKAATILGVNEYGRFGSIFVCQREGKQLNPHTYTLSGSLSILVLKAETQISETMEIIVIQRDENISHNKLWNQVDHGYSLWAMGKIKTCNRTVIASQFGQVPSDPPEFSTGQTLPGDTDETGVWLKKQKTVNVRAKVLGEGSWHVSGLPSRVIYTKTVTENYLFVGSESTAPNILSL